jgi:ribosomal protein L40E
MVRDLVTVASFQFPAEAEVARMHLQEKGIQAFLADAETVSMDWLLGNAIGYVKLQVPSDQAQAAHSFLEEVRAGHVRNREGSQPATDAAVCLECGADLPAGSQRCARCGWSYATKEGQSLEAEETPEDEQPDSEDPSKASATETLRSWKRPIILLLLSPLFLVIGLLALFLLAKVILP